MIDMNIRQSRFNWSAPFTPYKVSGNVSAKVNNYRSNKYRLCGAIADLLTKTVKYNMSTVITSW